MGIGEWIAGCDVCRKPAVQQDRQGTPSSRRTLRPRPPEARRRARPADVLAWTAEDRARVFRGSSKRIKLDMVRDAIIALGNAEAINPDQKELLDAVRVSMTKANSSRSRRSMPKIRSSGVILR